jgi:hypothetical protein
MTSERSAGTKAALYVSVLILVPVVALLAFSWADKSTDLTPGHAENIVAVALAAPDGAVDEDGGHLVCVANSVNRRCPT